MEMQEKLPHNFEALMKEFNPPLGDSFDGPPLGASFDGPHLGAFNSMQSRSCGASFDGPHVGASNSMQFKSRGASFHGPQLRASFNDWIPLLKDGVFLDNNKIYYWLDKLGRNCFKLFARRLSITWSGDPRYWKWERVKEVRNTEVEVAHLLNVCWLEVNGTFKTSFLSPGVRYEVVFEVKMEEPSHGWSTPVTLKLEGPDGRTQERKEKLGEKPKGKWIELPVGDFVSNLLKNEEIKFSLVQYKDGAWKSGLVIKAVSLRPKMRCG